jgi:hypothetical protein
MNAKRMVFGVLAFALCWASCDDAEDEWVDARLQCVERINEYRATLALTPLEQWSSGEGCADKEARKDARTGVAHSAFGSCDERAQNECPGWPSAEAIVEGCLQSMWDEGPGEPYSEHGHYINMSNPGYTLVACGFHETSDGAVWGIQNFQ